MPSIASCCDHEVTADGLQLGAALIKAFGEPTNEAESIIAAMLAAVAAGSISDVKTARAWTGAEFKAIAEKASKAAREYRVPGKS
jgi:hypothetical protein